MQSLVSGDALVPVLLAPDRHTRPRSRIVFPLEHRALGLYVK